MGLHPPQLAMEGTPNWLEMPHEIMAMILERLGAVEILNRAQKVCTTWRRICKDPLMWKIINIDLDYYLNFWYTEEDFEKLSKQAVHRSCGELVHISLACFGTDDLLDFISRCSSKLNSLRLEKCYSITGSGLINALKRLPHLETLDLFYIFINAEDVEVIGQSCPHLKSFKMKTLYMECDAYAIANSMPALRHLQLVGNTYYGIRAILNGCPHLESLDLSGCFNLHLDENLEKLCREQIKDFKFKRDNNTEVYEDSDYEEDYDGSWLY